MSGELGNLAFGVVRFVVFFSEAAFESVFLILVSGIASPWLAQSG
jgi:hypothetical protein